MNWSGMPNPNEDLRLHFALIALVTLAAWWNLPTLIGGIFVLAWVASRWVIMGLSWSYRRFHASRWKPWEGRYYAFQGRQVRVAMTVAADIADNPEDTPAGTKFCVSLDDLLAILEQPMDAMARRKLAARLGADLLQQCKECGGDALESGAALRWLHTLEGRTAQRLYLWLQREVLAPLERRAAG